MEIYEPGTEIGQYRILSAPMMGGMGVVYACHDLTNDRAVALKTFRPEYLPDRATREQFLREASAWVRLGSHPNIVRCYGVEYVDPITFLALEFILKAEHHDDASLSDWIGAPMPPAQALQFAQQIARGMLHATQKLPGFVHRDLKPDNILVGQDTLPGTNIPRLRVTDFGLVYFLRDVARSNPQVADPTAIGQTHLTQNYVGTPLYMAPEQWINGRTGVFTDVYAFGCILYEMLTGQRAASGENIEELGEMHCNGALRPISADLPKDLDNFLRRCRAVQGSERYQTWLEVIDALERVGKILGLSLPPVVLKRESIQEQHERAWSYNKIGLSYWDMGNARAAIGYYEKALAIFRSIGGRHGEGNSLNILGIAYYSLGEAQRAIEYYEQVLAIARAIGDRRGVGQVLSNLGLAYTALGDMQNAIGYYEEALEITREIGDRRGEGNALGNLGLAYADLGGVRRAIEYYEQVLAIVREIGDRRGEGTALNNLGSANHRLGDARCAIGYYEEALVIAREIGDRRGEGGAVGSLGSAHLQLGDAQRAIGYYELALNIFHEIGDRRGESATLNNLGLGCADLGDTQRAIGYYEGALVIAREIGDRHGEGSALGNLGIAYKDLGDARHAIGYYEKQLTIVREIGDRHGEGSALGNLGVAYEKLGDARRAIKCYDEAVAIAREIGDRYGESVTLHNLGDYYYSLGDTWRAIGCYKEALASSHEIGDVIGVATSSYNMARLYNKQGQSARAIHLAQEAERIWTQIGSPNAQKAHQLLAQLQSGVRSPQSANPTQAAFDAFRNTGNLDDMQAAVAQHPILRDPQFYAAIEQFIRKQAQREDKPAFEQRLVWLKQITGKQTGFLGRLFGK